MYNYLNQFNWWGERARPTWPKEATPPSTNTQINEVRYVRRLSNRHSRREQSFHMPGPRTFRRTDTSLYLTQLSPILSLFGSYQHSPALSRRLTLHDLVQLLLNWPTLIQWSSVKRRWETWKPPVDVPPAPPGLTAYTLGCDQKQEFD